MRRPFFYIIFIKAISLYEKDPGGAGLRARPNIDNR